MKNPNKLIMKIINVVNDNISSSVFWVILFITLPLIFYFSIFHYGFSRTAADWGAFGSFVSGVGALLTPLLTCVTIFILLGTLYESMKSYRLIDRKESIEIIRGLANELESSLKNGLHCQLTNKVINLDSLCKECNDFVIAALLAHDEGEQENELDEFSCLATLEYSSFEVLDGISLFIEIVEIIKVSDDEGNNYTSILKSIFMTRFNSMQRYWLYYLLDGSLYSEMKRYLFFQWDGFIVYPSILLNARSG